MNSLILLSLILISANCDQWGLIHFSKTLEQVRECLKNETGFNDDTFWKNILIDRLSFSVYSKTRSLSTVHQHLTILLIGLSRDILFDDYEMPFLELKIQRALDKCSDPESFYELPHFVDETPELGDLLNLILVKSERLIRQYNGLLLLSSFAEKSLSLMDRALRKITNSQEVLIELLEMWNRRSELYFDEEESELEYIEHLYTLDRPEPYTRNDPDLFTSRSKVKIEKPEDDVPEVTSYRVLNWQDPSRVLVYLVPEVTSPTKSREYFETRKTHFFQTLFLYLELVIRGYICGNKHRKLSEMIRGFMKVYRRFELHVSSKRYLETRQRKEVEKEFARESDIFSSLVMSLEDGERISEPDLLMMFWYRVKSREAKADETCGLVYENFDEASSKSCKPRGRPRILKKFKKLFV